MITRGYVNGFYVEDWTQEINVIPNSWGTIGQLGIFQEESVAEHTVLFEEIIKNGAVIVDTVRGSRNNVGKDYARKVHTFAIPHFTYDENINPSDIQGKRAYGSAAAAETLAAVRMRKMERAAMNHSWTLEAARAQAICAGTVYAPNGTVSQNWFTEFNKSQTSVDFVFGTTTTDIRAKIEQAIAAIMDNAGSSTQMTGIVCLCSPTWFAKLIGHTQIVTAYQYYASTQEPARQRLGGAMTLHREFFHMGVRFIEMRDAYNGTQLITADKAYFIPTGTDVFRTFFSPANRFDLVNTLGERMYMFETMDPKGTLIEIETESNFVNALMRPELVIEAITSN